MILMIFIIRFQKVYISYSSIYILGKQDDSKNATGT